MLDKEDNKILVISRDIIDAEKYYTETNSQDSYAWDNSYTRQYMNTVMFETVYNEEEQNCVVLSHVVTPDNVGSNKFFSWEKDGGKDTEDYLFLLSFKEVEKYYSSPDSRIVELTI
ncbi:MAG: hypothetical protein HUJ56_01040 [Erysipelotrichaceae bacterium]|nr:hypothetical protein [Erysipelotrichaceae bacterium]